MCVAPSAPLTFHNPSMLRISIRTTGCSSCSQSSHLRNLRINSLILKTVNYRRRLFLCQIMPMPTALRVHLPPPARPAAGLLRKIGLVLPVVSAGRGTGYDRHLPVTGFSFRRWFPIAHNGVTLRPRWQIPFSDIPQPFPPVFPRPRHQYNTFLP